MCHLSGLLSLVIEAAWPTDVGFDDLSYSYRAGESTINVDQLQSSISTDLVKPRPAYNLHFNA